MHLVSSGTAIVRSLRGLGVETSVITDFDVLNDEKIMQEIVCAAGGDWGAIKPDWSHVKRAVEEKKPELSTEEVKKEIEALLASAGGPMFPNQIKKAIQGVLRRSSPWSHAKSVGLSFIPNGQPTQAYMKLLKALEQLRIYVVPVGEVEGFVKSAGGHGPSWVAEVLKMDFKTDPELDPAKLFIRSIIT